MSIHRSGVYTPILNQKVRVEKTTVDIIQFNEYGEIEYKATREDTRLMVYDEQKGWVGGRVLSTDF